jgi:hypothetical protein
MFRQLSARGLAHLIEVAIITRAVTIEIDIWPDTGHGGKLARELGMLQETQALPWGKFHLRRML